MSDITCVAVADGGLMGPGIAEYAPGPTLDVVVRGRAHTDRGLDTGKTLGCAPRWDRCAWTI